MIRVVLFVTFVMWLYIGTVHGQTCGHTGLYQHETTASGNLTRLVQRNDGSIGFNMSLGDFGLEYPIGSGYSILFAGGIWFGGLKEGVGPAPDTANVAHVEYNSEWLPGRIINSGPFGDLFAELHDTAHTFFVLPEDASCWPAEAPHDQGGQPLQLSARDTWTVYNDLSIHLTDEPQYSPAPGFGLHMERQTFHFETYPLNHGVLVRNRIVNKSNREYPGFYIGIWNDPDVGSESVEDIVKLDSALSLVTVYSDPFGGDVHPVAYGCLLLQGATPVSVGDTAKVLDIGPDGFYVKLIPNRRLLMASSGTAYPNNVSGNCGQMTGDVCRYNYLQGLQAGGSPKPRGPWDPMNGGIPADQRTILSSGPFTLAAGDTQDVWYVMMGAQAVSSLIAVDSLRARVPLIRSSLGLDPFITSVRNPSASPTGFVLNQNSPNPFNPSTVISYQLPANSHATLRIFNLLGQEVRTLVNGLQTAGEHEVTWDGKDNGGRAVASGVYLYRLEAGGQVKTRKLMLLK